MCRSGLATHPGYLSARVTLGRALFELNQLDEAKTELEKVLKAAPENLAAIRGVAEIHHRRDDLESALAMYRAALALARNDPDLQETVSTLAGQVAASKVQDVPEVEEVQGVESVERVEEVTGVGEVETVETVEPIFVAEPSVVAVPVDDPELARGQRMIAALEQWLDAIHVARSHRVA